MKKTIIILSMLLITGICTQASPYTPTLGKIENVLYGFQYDNEDDTSRLDRIENSVYGTSTNGTTAQRISKLKKDLSADLIGQEIEPKEDTFADDEVYFQDEPIADANIQYPAVDELEESVFNKSFTSKDIKERLSALEQKTFGQTFNDDLASRVDRLKAEIRPNSLMGNGIAQSSNDFFDNEDVVALEKNYHLDRYESPNQFDYDAYNAAHNPSNPFPFKKANITTVENGILNRSFKNESMENRLSRLENVMFGTEFTQDDNQTRAERIASAYKAQKSASKYDNNKFSQNMATAMQIGTLILMVLACIL